MNRAFAGATSRSSTASPFRFRLASIDVTANDRWYAPSDPLTGLDNAKRRLHRGSRTHLNVYLNGGPLAFSRFPWRVRRPRLDGIVLPTVFLPNSKRIPDSEGDSLVHEVGHWLGLFHTFENGCRWPGDLVKDTPRQLDEVNVFECQTADTCPRPGNDPIHNYMNYAPDPCAFRFTHGQVVREVVNWAIYRVRSLDWLQRRP